MGENGFFRNLSVGQRMGMGFGLTGLMFLVVVWQYHTTLYEALNRYDHLMEVHETKKSLSLNIHRYMLEARRSEKDFLSRKDHQYIERVARQVDLALQDARQLQGIEERAGGQRVAERIRERLGVYHNAFKQIVEAWEIKGLDHNQGLRGRFRETIHAVEEKVGQFKTSALYLTLLQIRRAEKDLGLRREQAYLKRVVALGQQFNRQVQDSGLVAADKTRLSQGMERYLNHFQSYADGVLAGEDIAGGKGLFRDEARELEAFIQGAHVADLEEDILSLRRREKDYLIRGDERYARMVQRGVERVSANIAASKISSDDRSALLALLKRYETDFLALVEQNHQIVRLTSLMRGAVHQVEPLVEAHVVEAVADMARAEKVTRANSQFRTTFALFLAATAILVGGVFSVFMTRRITDPVTTLIRLADLFSGEEPDDQAPPQKDEIKALAAAMGRMSGTLREIFFVLSEHAEDESEIAKGFGRLIVEMEQEADTLQERLQALRKGNEADEDLNRVHQSMAHLRDLIRAVRAGNSAVMEMSEELDALVDRFPV
ncbi:MAG: methyl-accepting chemotaxis protein [Magnetococcales bacterium]|nr:methyl-accepting chemotaxis protein [Magnetococcales bacterium]